MSETTHNQPKYNVVFEYTEKAEGYQGVRTITPFRDEAHFKEWYTPEVKAMQKAIAQGLSTEDAVALCEKTPMDSYVSSARQDATSRNGKFNKKVFDLEMSTILLSKRMKD